MQIVTASTRWVFILLAMSACFMNSPLRAAASLASESVAGSKEYRAVAEAYLKHQKLTPKIIGGAPAAPGSYPWQVSLEASWIADPLAGHFCGGTVYSATWVVTAAHCVQGLSPKDVLVTAGTHSLGKGGVRVNVNRIFVKSEYMDATHNNDIALLELFDPLPLGKDIAALAAVEAASEPTLLVKDAPLVVTGWGATSQGGKPVRDLRFVGIPFVERTDCNRPLAYDNNVTENMICAGAVAGGKDSCQGDSGGPLTVTKGDHALLAGVVSWGEGCANPNKVGVYTRVANYATWIAACVADTTKCH
jgi:secreted trypsin-like serine protease